MEGRDFLKGQISGGADFYKGTNFQRGGQMSGGDFRGTDFLELY